MKYADIGFNGSPFIKLYDKNGSTVFSAAPSSVTLAGVTLSKAQITNLLALL